MAIHIETTKAGMPLQLKIGMLTIILPSIQDDGKALLDGVLQLFARRQGIASCLSMTSPHGDIIDGVVSDALNTSRIDVRTNYGDKPTLSGDLSVESLAQSGALPTHVGLFMPEYGKHPARCLDLADQLITLAKANVYTLVATYSHEILRRVQRRVAEGSVPVDMVEVILLVSDPLGGEDLPKRLPLDEYGRVDAPAGFFDERLNEARDHVKAIIERKRANESSTTGR